MLLCLSCMHFYRLCPVPEKMEPKRQFASRPSYRPEGCAQFEPVKFKRDNDYALHKQPKKPHNHDRLHRASEVALDKSKGHQLEPLSLPCPAPSNRHVDIERDIAQKLSPRPSHVVGDGLSDLGSAYLWRFDQHLVVHTADDFCPRRA